MPVYRIYGTQFNAYELWVEAKDEQEASTIAEKAPQKTWTYTGEDFNVYVSGYDSINTPDDRHKEFLYVPKKVTNDH